MAKGQRLREVRKFLRLSQKEFVKPLDIDQSTLSHIESEDPRYPISKKTEARLIAAYKVNMDYINNGTPPMILSSVPVNMPINNSYISDPETEYNQTPTDPQKEDLVKKNQELERRIAELEKDNDIFTVAGDDC